VSVRKSNGAAAAGGLIKAKNQRKSGNQFNLPNHDREIIIMPAKTHLGPAPMVLRAEVKVITLRSGYAK